MSRHVQVVLLCEDTQQEVFARRFLKAMGWSTRRMRIEKSQQGSAEQFVRQKYPDELSWYRSKRNQVGQALVVMADGDRWGAEGRLAMFDGECERRNVPLRTDGERVAVFVPTWCIETWLAHLDGEAVDEGKKDYPKLDRESHCQRHVNTLVQMCRSGKLREPVPPSLIAACHEYNTRLAK